MSTFALFQNNQETRGLVLKGRESQKVKISPIGLDYEGSYALVIGMRKYRFLDELPGAEKDANEITQVLKEQGFEVETHYNLSSDRLRQVIPSFVFRRGKAKDNRILIYFAGHGATLNADSDSPIGYIVPIDAPVPQSNEEEFTIKAINMDTIRGWVRQVRAKHALFAFDSCFSGTLFDIFRDDGAPPPEISQKTSERVRQFITAGTANQRVPDESVFRKYFVRGLRGEADVDKDGYITGEELGIYLKQQVSRERRGEQTPQYGKLRDADLGDFVFVSPLATVAVIPPSSKVKIPTGEQEYWMQIRNSTEPEDFRTHIENYCKSDKGEYCLAARKRLQGLMASNATSSPVSRPSPLSDPATQPQAKPAPVELPQAKAPISLGLSVIGTSPSLAGPLGSPPNAAAPSPIKSTTCFAPGLILEIAKPRIKSGEIVALSTRGVNGGESYGSVTYSWTTTAGVITGTGMDVRLETAGVRVGSTIELRVVAESTQGSCLATGSGQLMIDDPAPTPMPTAPLSPAAPIVPTSVAGPGLIAVAFETVEIDDRGRPRARHQKNAKGYREELGNGVSIMMVEIEAGTFLMGARQGEAGAAPSEQPLHEVKVPGFLMSQHEITQAQWRAVAQLPRVRIELKPNPSRFAGDLLPVEQVSWAEAAEFCERLSRATGRYYRLPSEAEWEYACRAGTSTPFAFGKTVSPELVNYDGTFPYAPASKGRYLQKTTEVGSLGIANAFGLYDMHGNVAEWCADLWHDDYSGAPTDGSAWIATSSRNQRVVRGGNWFKEGSVSRSAHRTSSSPLSWSYSIGLRIVAVPQ